MCIQFQLPLKDTSTWVTSGSNVRRASRNAERVEGVSDFGEDAWTQLESSCEAKVETFQQVRISMTTFFSNPTDLSNRLYLSALKSLYGHTSISQLLFHLSQCSL